MSSPFEPPKHRIFDPDDRPLVNEWVRVRHIPAGAQFDPTPGKSWQPKVRPSLPVTTPSLHSVSTPSASVPAVAPARRSGPPLPMMIAGLAIAGCLVVGAVVMLISRPKAKPNAVGPAFSDPPLPTAVEKGGLKVQLQFANKDDANNIVIGRPLDNVGLTIEADPKIVSLTDVSVVDDNGYISPAVRRARVEREPGASVFVVKFPILVKKSLLSGGDAAFPLSITFGATPVFANGRMGTAISMVLPPYALRLNPPKRGSQGNEPIVRTREGRPPRTRPRRNPTGGLPKPTKPAATGPQATFNGTDN